MLKSIKIAGSELVRVLLHYSAGLNKSYTHTHVQFSYNVIKNTATNVKVQIHFYGFYNKRTRIKRLIFSIVIILYKIVK